MLELLLHSPATTAALCLGAALLYAWLSSRRLPPGPRGIPLLGCVWLMQGDRRKVFADLRKRYGDIFSFRLGTRLVVVVNGYEAIKEALVNQNSFNDRPQVFTVTDIGQGKGIINNSGPSWWEQRKFTVHKLRQFGIGTTSFEEKVKDEFSPFLNLVRQQDGADFDPEHAFQTAIANIICSIVFGKRFEYEDALFVSFLDIFEENMRLIGGTPILNFYPCLRYLPGDLFKFKKTVENVFTVQKFLKIIVENHKATLVPGKERDFTDAYLLEMARVQAHNPNTSLQPDQLLKLLGDLFVAGTETTATTLRWALVFLVLHPEVQERMRSEIRAVIPGSSRWPEMDDRGKMPYVNAVIQEVQRLADIAPFSIAHSSPAECQVFGMDIPPGSIVVPNLNSVHFDPVTFPDPTHFRPERFLDQNGGFVLHEHVIPFSLGRRQCPGMALAKMELFLFLTVLVQNFDIRPPEDPVSHPVMESIPGLTYVPRDYKVRFVSLDLPQPSE